MAAVCQIGLSCHQWGVEGRQLYAACQLSSQTSAWVVNRVLGQDGRCFLLLPQPEVSVYPLLTPPACHGLVKSAEFHFIGKAGPTGAAIYFPHSYGFHSTPVGYYKWLLIMVKFLVQGITWGKKKCLHFIPYAKINLIWVEELNVKKRPQHSFPIKYRYLFNIFSGRWMGMKKWYKNHKGKDKNNWSPESIQLLCAKKKKKN